MTNCPNCGAPIDRNYSYNCRYCNTWLNLDGKKPPIKKVYPIKPYEGKPIKIEEIDFGKEALSANKMIIFRGTTEDGHLVGNAIELPRWIKKDTSVDLTLQYIYDMFEPEFQNKHNQNFLYNQVLKMSKFIGDD